jgi:glycosyltransferase involved in cell wall biosynthesis
MIKDSGTDEIVHRPGRIDLNELPGFYRTADLYISASHVDGSSVSLLEAMACGKPVVVSSIPANLEWVQEGRNGWIFPDGDESALERVIEEAGKNRDGLENYGKANRQVAEARADWKKNSRELFRAYQMALEVVR